MANEPQASDRVFTVPNLISLIRLLAIPVFWWLLLGADDLTAATILFAVIAGTDWVDGFLARRLDQVTKLGKSLDPVADRLMIASAVIAGLIAGIVPAVIGLTLMAREVYMAGVAGWLALRGGGTLEVRWLGKVATFAVYSAIGWFYMAEIPFLEVLTRPLAWVVGIGGLILYWVTAIQYTADTLATTSELESRPTREEN